MTTKRKLLIISPVAKNSLLGGDFFFRLPTLGALKVAALTPDDWEIEIIDEKTEPVDLDADADVVGITAMTPAVNRGYEIADHFRSRGITVIMGGIHPSSLPEEALKHCDSVVVGEAEGLWAGVLEDFNKGELKRIYKNDDFPCLDGLPLTDWKLYEGKNFLPVHFVETTRGCPHDCNFCTVTNAFGGKFRSRPIDEVLAELDTLEPFDGRFILKNVVFFVDDNIISNRRYAREFLKRIIPYNLKWLGQASVNIIQDDEIMRLLEESGCMGLVVGFESVSQTSLNNAGKSFNHPDKFIEVIQKLHDRGVGVNGAFILGFDDDDERCFDETLEFVTRAKIDACNFTVLTPFPATRLYDEFNREGRIIDHDWANYTTNSVVYKPKRMTPEQLIDGYHYVLKNAYTVKSIFKRLWGTGTYKNFFWPMNYGLRRSINKQLREGQTRLIAGAAG